jgi:hypothetical protein
MAIPHNVSLPNFVQLTQGPRKGITSRQHEWARCLERHQRNFPYELIPRIHWLSAFPVDIMQLSEAPRRGIANWMGELRPESASKISEKPYKEMPADSTSLFEDLVLLSEAGTKVSCD